MNKTSACKPSMVFEYQVHESQLIIVTILLGTAVIESNTHFDWT